MGHGKVGLIYLEAPDGGAFHIEDGELLHTPMLADGRIEWGAGVAVDFARIEPELVREALGAGRELCKRLGYDPAQTREILHDREDGHERTPDDSLR